jgi:hypothetical protein
MAHPRIVSTRLGVAAAGVSVLLAIWTPFAFAVPQSDEQGYIDSTARCSSPNVAMAFGVTASSRVAICRTPTGEYQYRGVRVRDGAKLILPASSSGDGMFVADNDGIIYTVTSSSLAVGDGDEILREEQMLDFHGPSGAEMPSSPATSAPPVAATPRTSATTAPTTTWQPPLAAEVGGSGSS